MICDIFIATNTLGILENFCKVYWLLSCCQTNSAIKKKGQVSYWHGAKALVASQLWTVHGVPSAQPGRLGKNMWGLLLSPSPEAGEIWWGNSTWSPCLSEARPVPSMRTRDYPILTVSHMPPEWHMLPSQTIPNKKQIRKVTKGSWL